MKQTMRTIGGQNARLEFYMKPERAGEGLISIKAFHDGHVHVYATGADMPWRELVAWLANVIAEISIYYVE